MGRRHGIVGGGKHQIIRGKKILNRLGKSIEALAKKALDGRVKMGRNEFWVA